MTEPIAEREWRQALSALADGEASEAELAQLLAAWPEQAGLRRDWHAYQLLGDALRSVDLAGDAGRDQRLLQRLRPLLGAQPAPRPALLPRWLAPLAVAAGFVMLIAGLNGLQGLVGLSPGRVATPPELQAVAPAVLPGLPVQGPSFAQSVAPAAVLSGQAPGGAGGEVLWRDLDLQAMSLPSR